LIIIITTGAQAEVDHVTELAVLAPEEAAAAEVAEAQAEVPLDQAVLEEKIVGPLGAGQMVALGALIQVLVVVVKHHKATLQAMKQEIPEPVVLEF
jgi:hypothetical protein